MRPDLSLVGTWYHGYISLVPEDNLAEAFEQHTRKLEAFLNSVPREKYDYRYAPGKWSIKQVLQHIIDAERVFAYRALRFARKDETALPGFDENLFADNAKTENRSWSELVEECKAVRLSSRLMFTSFDEEQLNAKGTASGSGNYVLGWAYILLGHVTHHINIVEERYL
jgi:uncharacterized damage-inducible protein DinB